MSIHSALNLEQSREALEFVVGLSQIRLWRWDLASNQVRLDAATAAACGLPHTLAGDDFVGKAIQAADQPAFRGLIAQASASPSPSSAHIRVLETSGTVRQLDASVRVIRDYTGRAVQVLIATRVSAPAEQSVASETDPQQALVERLSIATQAAGIYVWEFDWVKNAISWDENRLSRASLQSPLRAGTGQRSVQMGSPGGSWASA